MSFESGFLGLFDTKKGQGIICEENILKGPYKNQKTLKKLKKSMMVFLYGEMKIQMNY